MFKELKDEWVKALRSGKYKQGRGKLYQKLDDSFCCLGVLCDVAKVELDPEGGNALVDNNTGYELIGVLLGYESNVFYGMNDFEHKSFIEIADYIEKEVPEE